MNTIKEILKDHRDYREQLPKLARSDLKKAYSGALLGGAWALIRPAILIFVFWFAFTIGLRHGKPVDGYPYFLWLIAGMIPWFFMRDMLTGGAAAIRKYKYLVTKIKFPISTIPTFVGMSYMVTHAGLMALMIVIFWLFGFPPTLYYLQLPFFMILSFLFWTAWALFASILSAVSVDFLNLIRALSQALFWMSGILYNANNIENDIIRKALLFNPVTILVNGYRNVFIYHHWFWEHPSELRNFFLVYVIMCALAIWAYKKLRKDLPDVL